MKAPDPIIIDFETAGIEARPLYPPVPASVSIIEPGKKPVFLAWGHPSGNNTSKQDAKRIIRRAWEDPRGVCFHNGKFDVDVGETHLQLPRLPEDRMHDTMFLAFLANPDRVRLNLDNVAHDELKGLKEWKEGKLKEWVMENVKDIKPSQWGAHICKAPAELVRPRAVGDADATGRLFKKLYAQVAKRGMEGAYRREQRLMPHLLDSERRGIRVNLRLMERDLALYEYLLEHCDFIIRTRLRSPDLDVNKQADLAEALDKAKMVKQWTVSDSGKKLLNEKVIGATIKDKGFVALLAYRNALTTSVRTFMRPWTEVARQTGGFIHTTWNQVRSDYHGDAGGARTGRLSSSPNFQNIPIYTRQSLSLLKIVQSGYMKSLMHPELFKKFPWAKTLKFSLVTPEGKRTAFNHACPLPMMKGYILPFEKDHVLVERDYSQQEFRILAHYEDGPLLERYRENPGMDVHDAARDLIHEQTGTMLDRRPVKDVGFSLIYGMGLDELARKIESDRQMAKELKGMYLNAIPGLKTLQSAIKFKAASGEPIVTWGGRQYFCEPPSYSKKFKRWMQYDYKLINRLIQGSAADCTKEGTCRYHELPESKRHGGLFMMTVHDSTVNSVPKKAWQQGDQALRRSMESVEFDVPMLTDGKMGNNLSEMRKVVDAL